MLGHHQRHAISSHGVERSGSGQVWEYTLEQRVAASTWRRYSLGLRLAIAQADARPAAPKSSDKTPPDATTMHAGGFSAWSCLSDPERTESDERDPMQGLVLHARRRRIWRSRTIEYLSKCAGQGTELVYDDWLVVCGIKHARIIQRRFSWSYRSSLRKRS